MKLFVPVLFTALLALPLSAWADPVPGNACATNNQVTHSGGPENSGNAYWMVCQGGTWRSIISSDANGMASTSTPTAAAHIATKGYVDAQAAGSLNVYKYDGVTLVGKFIGTIGDQYYSSLITRGASTNGLYACVIMAYLNTAIDQVSVLSYADCGYSVVSGRVGYSNMDCTGTQWFLYGNTYLCTGSGACPTTPGTLKTADTANPIYVGGGFTPLSERGNGGACQYMQYPNTYYMHYPAIPYPGHFCGNEPDQYCKVKP